MCWFSRQRSGSQEQSYNDCLTQVQVRASCPSTIQLRSSPQRYLFNPKFKKKLRGRKISDENEVKEAILAHFEGREKNIIDGL